MNKNVSSTSSVLVKTAVIIVLLCVAVAPSIAADATPNVVLIFADDLGYGDLGCYGATKVQTPNIDRLAKEGRRFTDAHSASAVCTPSRYALLTGEYPVRAGGGAGVWGPAPVTSGLIIDTDKVTIADVFKNKGYATAALGKWHLGFGEGTNNWQEPLRPGPQDLGFDYYFGLPVVNSAPPYVYVENDRIVGGDPADPLIYLGRGRHEDATPITEIPPEASQRTPNMFKGAVEAHKNYNDYTVGTVLANKAVDWLTANKQQPFFLYLATTHIHHPFTPGKRFQGTSDAELYGDFIQELDWIVGEVTGCLEQHGLSENTLVIFTSDNGGMLNLGGRNAVRAGHLINGDLLGFKFGAWEGGHRVPFIARWPGNIEAGTESDQLICNVDMLASFMALTGQDSQILEDKDSVNILPALLGNPKESLREDLVLAPSKSHLLSLRKGKWMYIPGRGSGGFRGSRPQDHAWGGPAAVQFVGGINSDIENGRIKKDAPPAQLYDLEADVNQTRNLYAECPEVVEEMSARLAAYAPPKQVSAPRKGNAQAAATKGAAKKTAATPSPRSVSFDFESGKLEPWKVVEGDFGHIVGNRDSFFHNKGEYNKQGDYYLSTLEINATAESGSDQQTGVIVSPLFIPKGGEMTFRVGGGGGPATYVALCTADGTEVQTARGVNNQLMQKASWDLTSHVGKRMFIKIVDESTDGWGHITADNFQFDAAVLAEYPEVLAQASETKTVTVTYSEAQGIGAEEGVMRRDPSDIIKVDDLFYVWYSKGTIGPGYDATVWYATSPDGQAWTEQGMALAKGEAGTWEGASVFTPNILVAEGRYWLFYTGTSRKFGKPFNPDSKIGIAVSDSPDGPWERLATNPALKNSDDPEDFDNHLVDDACLIKREGKYWFYYKGRQLGKGPGETQLGLAIAEEPQGPYVRVEENPVIPGNHEVLVWPQGKGVATMIGTTGPKEITRSIMYSEDGLHFSKTHNVIDVPHAAGGYRPEAFTDSGLGKQIEWGVHIGKRQGFLPFIERIDLSPTQRSSDQGL